MEFMFRAGESNPHQRLPPPCPRPRPLPPPLPLIHPNPSSLESLHRELHEERIKEEILIRRLNQRRMLQELTTQPLMTFLPPPPIRRVPVADVDKKRKRIDTAAENNADRNKRRVVSTQQIKEWGCALCMVSATDEDGLRKHIEGRKHRVKAAGLSRGSGKNKGKEGPTIIRR